MTAYRAVKNNTAITLKSDADMDQALSNGFSIFVDTGSEEVLIADPDTGFLTDRPVFGPTACRSEASDLRQALNIILGGDA